MLASSSKRALSSTSAVTDLPASAASDERAERSGCPSRCGSSVCLIATTFGIARRLAQELHHDVERLVGMMDDQVLLADRREAITGVVADALREARIVRHELEIGPIDSA